MNAHIDTLDKWWENAETGRFREGDSLIFKYGDEYTVQPAYEDGEISRPDEERILDRAPKPKPAWHDAVAVIASTRFTGRQVWERCTGEWCGTAGDEVCTDDLTDVTPLIEQKVTQPMIDRARAESMKWDFGGLSGNAVDSMLTAALGLDPA